MVLKKIVLDESSLSRISCSIKEGRIGMLLTFAVSRWFWESLFAGFCLQNTIYRWSQWSAKSALSVWWRAAFAIDSLSHFRYHWIHHHHHLHRQTHVMLHLPRHLSIKHLLYLCAFHLRKNLCAFTDTPHSSFQSLTFTPQHFKNMIIISNLHIKQSGFKCLVRVEECGLCLSDFMIHWFHYILHLAF